MITIRLSKTGRKKVSTFRIVVVDSRKKRDGEIVERLGDFNPMTKPSTFHLNHERALQWLKKGARPSDTVRTILHRDGVIKKFQLLQKGLDIGSVTLTQKAEKVKKPAKSKKATAKEKGVDPKAAETPAAEAPKETTEKK